MLLHVVRKPVSALVSEAYFLLGLPRCLSATIWLHHYEVFRYSSGS